MKGTFLFHSLYPQASFGDVVVGENGNDWLQSKSTNPVAIKQKLQPVYKLFTPDIMSQSRVVFSDGSPIDSKAILGWFLPRYQNICHHMDKIYADKPGLKSACREKFCPPNNTCRKNVERCRVTRNNTDGYECEFFGCKNKNLCPDSKTKCVNNENSHLGYRCVDLCPRDACR